MDALWKGIDKRIQAMLADAAAQGGRLEAAAQAASAAAGEDLGACPSNTPPSSSQIILPGFPEYRSTFGIDWLACGGVLLWASDPFAAVMDQLEGAKLNCQSSEQEQLRIRLNGVEPVYVQRLGMKRGKSGGVHFEYRFTYKGISISLARRPGTLGGAANFFVTLTGKECLLLGALEAYAAAKALMVRLGAGQVHEEKISRVDLRLDVAGLPVDMFQPLIDERCFITRVREIQAWDNKVCGLWTGTTIGKYPRLLRIYDKKADQQRKYDAEVYQALIDRVWGGREPEFATRLEWELGRTYLKRYGIHTLADLQALLGSLLAQLTNEFFRFTVEPVISADKHQSRAEVHPLWKAIQSALLQHAQVPAQKLVPIRYANVHPRRLVAQAVGCLVSAALQKMLVLPKFEDFLLTACGMICEVLPDEYARQRFLKKYWQRFKDKPGDYGLAA